MGNLNHGAGTRFGSVATMMPIDTILARLDDARPAGRDRWRSRCPSCGGGNSSALSVGIGNGDAVLLRCWKGCDAEQVARAIGLELNDLCPPRLTDRGSRSLKRRGMLSARQALDVIENETTLVWTAAANMANGYTLTANDRQRLNTASARIQAVCDEVRA